MRCTCRNPLDPQEECDGCEAQREAAENGEQTDIRVCEACGFTFVGVRDYRLCERCHAIEDYQGEEQYAYPY